MIEKSQAPKSVDEYIEGFEEPIGALLQQIRQVIKENAPEAEECISYMMPAYKLNGVLVYFAAQKHHIGFYPTGSGIENFKHEFDGYKWSKGAVQFPLNKPIPFDLIKRIVQFRVDENFKKSLIKKKK